MGLSSRFKVAAHLTRKTQLDADNPWPHERTAALGWGSITITGWREHLTGRG